jgi:hypothetical protein
LIAQPNTLQGQPDMTSSTPKLSALIAALFDVDDVAELAGQAAEAVRR